MKIPGAGLAPEEIVRRSGSSFVSSFVFLGAARRRSMRAVYAFCKVVDDAGDVLVGEEARGALAFWREELRLVHGGAPRTPVGRALAVAVAAHGVPEAPLGEVIRGVEMDLAGTEYRSFEDLVVYCRRVASAVGLACLPVLGASERVSGEYADRLGIALQFTNILRDLGVDARAGRVYLPGEDLERFGLSAGALRGGGPAGAVEELLAFEGERARGLFAQADAAMPVAERAALLPARMMGAVYRELLEAVLAAGGAGLARPPARIPRRRKMLVMLRTWLGRNGQP